jgi:hypothetical protein
MKYVNPRPEVKEAVAAVVRDEAAVRYSRHNDAVEEARLVLIRYKASLRFLRMTLGASAAVWTAGATLMSLDVLSGVGLGLVIVAVFVGLLSGCHLGTRIYDAHTWKQGRSNHPEDILARRKRDRDEYLNHGVDSVEV